LSRQSAVIHVICLLSVVECCKVACAIRTC